MNILVTSSKGGIGKSTVSAGLAVAFARRGRRVLLVDCDLYGRCLDMMLGVEDSVMFNIGDLSAGRAECKDVLIKPQGVANFAFCAGTSVYCEEDFSDGKLLAALHALEEYSGADYIICDTAGMLCAPEIAEKFADMTVFVATQQPASIRAASSTAVHIGAESTRLIINGFDINDAVDKCRAGVLDIIDGSGLVCTGIVPYDRALMLACENGEIAVFKNKSAMSAFENIAARLEGEQVRLFTGIKKISRSKRKSIL